VLNNWWDANALPKTELKVLMDDFYPYRDPDSSYDQPPPDKERYSQLILELCKKAGMVCSRDSIKYGDRNPPAKPTSNQ
jgi:hypothetical protein